MEKIEFKNGSGVFFTSDTHFGHENIISLCKRPFSSVEEMNEALIKNWNSVVGPYDTVFHLGDFGLGGSQMWNYIMDHLNGNIHLVLGNHDLKNMRAGYMYRFETVSQQLYIRVEDRSIYLNHCPLLCYGGSYRTNDPVWQLFGHVHSGPNSTSRDLERLKILFPYQYDVGVDNNNFTPISYYQVKEIINKQTNETL